MSELLKLAHFWHTNGFTDIWSFASTLVVPVLLSQSTWVYHYIRLRKLRRAFHRNAKSAEDFSISLPLWSLKAASRSTARFSRSDSSGRVEKLFGPTETFAKEDVLGAMQISDIFAGVFPNSVSVTLDNGELDVTRKTIIVIGSPAANFHARDLIERYRKFHGKELPVFYDDIEESEKTGAKLILKDNCGREFIGNASEEYAMIVRVRNHFGVSTGRYIYFIGGVHACGTLAAALYLRNNWQKFASADLGAVVLRVRKGRPEIYEVERFYEIKYAARNGWMGGFIPLGRGVSTKIIRKVFTMRSGSASPSGPNGDRRHRGGRRHGIGTSGG